MHRGYKTIHIKTWMEQSWFNCHRYFLDINHVYRNKDAFYMDKVKIFALSCRLIGNEV